MAMFSLRQKRCQRKQAVGRTMLNSQEPSEHR